MKVSGLAGSPVLERSSCISPYGVLGSVMQIKSFVASARQEKSSRFLSLNRVSSTVLNSCDRFWFAKSSSEKVTKNSFGVPSMPGSRRYM